MCIIFDHEFPDAFIRVVFEIPIPSASTVANWGLSLSCSLAVKDSSLAAPQFIFLLCTVETAYHSSESADLCQFVDGRFELFWLGMGAHVALSLIRWVQRTISTGDAFCTRRYLPTTRRGAANTIAIGSGAIRGIISGISRCIPSPITLVSHPSNAPRV